MTEEFNKADLNGRRGMLKSALRSAKKQIRERMDKGYTDGETYKLRIISKAMTKFPKEIQREADKAMKEKFGVDGSMDDYSFAELDLFIEYATYLKDAYDEAGQL